MLPAEFGTLGTFTLAALAVVMTPGPDTVLILRYTLVSGRAAGLATVAGVQVGLLGHTIIAIAGISVLIAASPLAFKAVTIVGAFYLAWLGVNAIREASALALNIEGTQTGLLTAGRQAALTNLLNPKVILLFLTLFPNFIVTGQGNETTQLLTLATTFTIINIIWQAPIALAANLIRRWLASDIIRRRISIASGVIFIGFAIGLLVQHLI
jgi:threonine/homoserine/homoserine lactone efflux protein